MMAWLGLRNERELHNLSPAMTGKLRMYLKNVVVRVSLSPKAIMSISDIVPEAGKQVFDGPDGRITVQVCLLNYFLNVYRSLKGCYCF